MRVYKTIEKLRDFINNLPDGGDWELVEEADEAIKYLKDVSLRLYPRGDEDVAGDE